MKIHPGDLCRIPAQSRFVSASFPGAGRDTSNALPWDVKTLRRLHGGSWLVAASDGTYIVRPEDLRFIRRPVEIGTPSRPQEANARTVAVASLVCEGRR